MATLKHPPTGAVSKADLEQFDLDQDARALHAAVSDLVRVYQFRDRDKICCYDVSVTQCNAMETLIQRGPMQMNELAAAMYLDKSTTSRVIDALERKKYVERIPSTTDGRAVALRVTRTGKSLNQKIHADLIAQQKELLRDLDPQLRATVADVIQRLAKAAEMRFISGASCGPQVGCCPPNKSPCS